MTNASRTVTISVSRDGRLPWTLEASGYAQISVYNSILKPILDISDRYYIKDRLLKSYYDYDKKAFIFIIPENLKFSNGREVLASDLEFSFARYFLTTKRAEARVLLSGIEGVENLKPGDEYVPGSISGIKVIDKHKVEVKLKYPNPSFMYSLSCSWISIVPQEELEDDYVTWKKHPIGAGDYKIANIDKYNRTTVLYTGRVPLSDHKPNEIIFDPTPDSLKHADIVAFMNVNPNERVYKQEVINKELGTTGLFFNYKNDLANDSNFRKAIAYGIKKDDIEDINGIYSQINSILTTNLFNSHKNVRKYNRETAIQSLKLVKIPTHKIKIAIGPKESELGDFDKKVLTRIHENLQDIGIECQYVYSDHILFNDQDDDIVLKYDYRGNGFYDQTLFFKAYSKSGGLGRLFPDDKKTIDSYNILLSELANASSEDIRAKVIGQLEDFFFNNIINIPLFQYKKFFWIKKDKIKTAGDFDGVSIDPSLIELQ